MFTKVPPIHPNEDMHSFAERQALINSNPPTTLARQGGGKWATPAWGLPTGLRQFASKYGAPLNLPTARDWMQGHTLAPYFLTTLPLQRLAAFEQRLLDYRPGPRRPLLAIAAAEWFAPVAVLCPACDDEHLKRDGYSIVLRQWLLPFATRCAVHGELLRTFPRWTPVDRGRGSGLEVRPLCKRQGIAASKVGEEMLRTGQSLLEELGHLLQSRGYLTASGRIRRHELCAALLAHAKGRYEHLELDALLSSQASVAKLLSPLWNPNKCLHPVVAIAVLETLRKAKEVNQGQLWSSTREGKRDALAEALKTCGTLTEIAKKTGVSVTTAAVQARAAGRAFVQRPKKLSASVRNHIESLLRAGHEIVDVAYQAGVSSVSVYRVLNANPQLKAGLQEERRSKEVLERRQAWLLMLQAHPSASCKELRAMAPADYAYLYRWERRWLSEHPPVHARGKAPLGARALRTPPGAAQELMTRLRQAKARDAMDLPPRLTATRLLKEAGRCNMSTCEKSQDIQQALAQATETLQVFVRRRLSAAAARLHNAQEPITATAIARGSGLRPETIRRSGVCIDVVMASTRAFNVRRKA